MLCCLRSLRGDLRKVASLNTPEYPPRNQILSKDSQARTDFFCFLFHPDNFINHLERKSQQSLIQTFSPFLFPGKVRTDEGCAWAESLVCSHQIVIMHCVVYATSPTLLMIGSSPHLKAITAHIRAESPRLSWK